MKKTMVDATERLAALLDLVENGDVVFQIDFRPAPTSARIWGSTLYLPAEQRRDFARRLRSALALPKEHQ